MLKIRQLKMDLFWLWKLRIIDELSPEWDPKNSNAKSGWHSDVACFFNDGISVTFISLTLRLNVLRTKSKSSQFV